MLYVSEVPMHRTLLLSFILAGCEPDAIDMTKGTFRYQQQLTPGATYTLSAVSGDGIAAAVLWLVDAADGGISILQQPPDELIFTCDLEPLTFVAPEGVASFVVQVQSGWQVTADTTLSLDLTVTPGKEEGSCDYFNR